MSLADYQPEQRVIPIGKTSFLVTGLSLGHITSLIRTHLDDLDALYDIGSKVIGNKVDVTEQDLTKIAAAVAEQAPGFVANLIALAAGEYNAQAINNAHSLPFPTQVKALIEIAELTFAEVGGVKKGLELVAGLLKNNQSESQPTLL